jgi:hypothetical protein
MKATSRIHIIPIATVVITLLAVVFAVGLTFAEETSKTTTQETAKAAQEATPQGAVGKIPEVPVQITPSVSKPFGRWQQAPIPMVSEIASVINMKVEDLVAARHEGKSFMEIAAEKGISESQLINALMEEQKAFLNTQVAEGRLTPEQAGTAISKMEENLKIALSRTEAGPPETKPNTGLGIGRKGMSRIPPARKQRMICGKHGFVRGISQGFQIGRRAGLRQGLEFGKGQGQNQGVCPFCGQPCPFRGQTQAPVD